MSQAYKSGLLSANHRSPDFEQLYVEVLAVLKKRLNVPEGYSLFFTSSATECWEVIAQSLVQQRSHHIYNGAFGQKWFTYTQRLRPQATGQLYDVQAPLPVDGLELPAGTEVLCVTQNETSNGTQVSNATLAALRAKHPEVLLAVDATSSMAGVKLRFDLADVWYASVQKCFGLPAGMAVMLCSERAIERAEQIGANSHYNSLPFMVQNMRKYQTTHTPNVLNIYLLYRTQKEARRIRAVDASLKRRAAAFMAACQHLPGLQPLVKNEAVRSDTVLVFEGTPELVAQVIQQAAQAGLVLGKGYGAHKTTTFRVANFPAVTDAEMNRLLQFLQQYFNTKP